MVFRLDYSISGSSTIQTFWAFGEKYEGNFYAADIDLASLVGKDIKFILTVLSAGSAAGDRALWVAPIIYNPASGSVSPSATSSVTPTATPTRTATPLTPAYPNP